VARVTRYERCLFDEVVLGAVGSQTLDITEERLEMT